MKELTNKVQNPGIYNIDFVVSGVSSGVYFCNLSANSTDGRHSFRSTRKMIFVK